jgi:hypothetical protein
MNSVIIEGRGNKYKGHCKSVEKKKENRKSGKNFSFPFRTVLRKEKQ